VYVSGLDPTYLLYANPELSKEYIDITLARTPDPADIIRDRFGARYVFTDAHHDDFVRNATADGKMKVAYEDEDTLVLVMNDGLDDAAP
jgi:hypothetical protein